jgi:hypothetical protein
LDIEDGDMEFARQRVSIKKFLTVKYSKGISLTTNWFNEPEFFGLTRAREPQEVGHLFLNSPRDLVILPRLTLSLLEYLPKQRLPQRGRINLVAMDFTPLP